MQACRVYFDWGLWVRWGWKRRPHWGFGDGVLGRHLYCMAYITRKADALHDWEGGGGCDVFFYIFSNKRAWGGVAFGLVYISIFQNQ